MAERPKDEEIAKWNRWFAVEAEPSGEQREEALLAAYASVYHWGQVGTEENRALGEMLLARVHVLAREPEPALRHAEASFRYFSGRESEPWQMALAHAMMADAAALAGDAEKHRGHYEQARDLGEALGDEDRSVVRATFDRVPTPGV